jgi:hypothetical protein
VPGVRGGVACKYTNFVIFRADRYSDWLDHNSEPRCIDALDRQVGQSQDPETPIEPPARRTPDA